MSDRAPRLRDVTLDEGGWPDVTAPLAAENTTPDFGDAPQVKKKENAAAREAKKRDSFLGAAMETQEGRDFFWWLLGQCGVYQNPFAANALVMAMKSGQMNIGQILLGEINRVAPDAYIRMMQERLKE